ncbi:hypothetical protein SIO17_24040 [Pseudoalteromonas piscicida]|uniref:Uncharacterized protein n=1 Tax=Pseudoalteromonas piscicida TaxID=43662 RepID=A0ABN5CN97_PSEO7|nr:hypothetical protein [Pseudoalteromonas piscicida]ATD10236.1 hypothetical protein PPIS_b1230 [Pseudoalteromonas piscicida]WPU32077.1 hypothetical protein SIO17_24040 [Pseudoalteromonas piscicida]
MKTIKRKKPESVDKTIEELSIDDFRLAQVAGAGVNTERNTEHNNNERNGSGNGDSFSHV